MLPGSPHLVERGGLNPHLFNAERENDLQSGVLTAVEDFLKESEQALELVKLPGLHGLGVLIPTLVREQKPELGRLLEDLALAPFARRHVDLVEEVRIETEIKRQERISALRNEVKCHEERLEHQSKIMGQQSQDINRLIHWIDELNLGISAMLNSWRWRFGNTVGEIRRRLLLKPKVPMASDHLLRIMRRVDKWRKRYSDRKHEGYGIRHIPPIGHPYPVERGEERFLKPTPTPSVPSHITVDIVICVHNALDDVKTCLESVVRNTSASYGLYIINDGSNDPTTEYLRSFRPEHRCVLLENSVAEGYTKAANKGLRASDADYIILLNSDTIVPSGWVERLLECSESDPRIGIIGPLSNAASWQSIPKRFDVDGGWATNSLPNGFSVGRMAEFVSMLSEKRFPRVPFLNGFCFAIERSVIDAIGYFDEAGFPKGYGEENDYCIRAKDAGFDIAVADHVYVYHSKSKSYGHTERKLLAAEGLAKLERKYGRDRVFLLLDELKNGPILERIRQRFQVQLESNIDSSGRILPPPFKVIFILPVKGGGGGAHSVIQEAEGMLKLGVFTKVAVPLRYKEKYRTAYPNVIESLFKFYDSDSEIIRYARNFEIAVATIFTSVKLLKQVCEADPKVIPAYYIQDYEPWIVKGDATLEKEAEESYTQISDILSFAKTDWLVKTVWENCGVDVQKVNPSFDSGIFYPDLSPNGDEDPVKIAAMVRPKTPRRSPEKTMQVLKAVREKYGDRVAVTIFGCESDDPQFLRLPRDFEFDHRGILVREEVADLFRHTDVFIDVSEYQAFGRAGLEAMACGCATVLPGACGTEEYATHRDNALLVNTRDKNEVISAIEELIESETFRKSISAKGILTALNYNVTKSVISELMLFKDEVRRRHSDKHGTS
ncbi:MAG: glycosyltransferase [Deltaproteobacteria bacterium]|nr:glycosyltransferase [Deltaproteobacteria bacterium]